MKPSHIVHRVAQDSINCNTNCADIDCGVPHDGFVMCYVSSHQETFCVPINNIFCARWYAKA